MQILRKLVLYKPKCISRATALKISNNLSLMKPANSYTTPTGPHRDRHAHAHPQLLGPCDMTLLPAKRHLIELFVLTN